MLWKVQRKDCVWRSRRLITEEILLGRWWLWKKVTHLDTVIHCSEVRLFRMTFTISWHKNGKKNRASMLHPSPSDNHPGPCFLDTFRLLITEFIYWNFDLTSLERSKKLEPYEDCTPHPHLPHQVEVRSKEFEEDKRKREIWPTNSGVADGWGVHVYMGNLPWSLT